MSGRRCMGAQREVQRTFTRRRRPRATSRTEAKPRHRCSLRVIDPRRRCSRHDAISGQHRRCSPHEPPTARPPRSSRPGQLRTPESRPRPRQVRRSSPPALRRAPRRHCFPPDHSMHCIVLPADPSEYLDAPTGATSDGGARLNHIRDILANADQSCAVRVCVCTDASAHGISHSDLHPRPVWKLRGDSAESGPQCHTLSGAQDREGICGLTHSHGGAWSPDCGTH